MNIIGEHFLPDRVIMGLHKGGINHTDIDESGIGLLIDQLRCLAPHLPNSSNNNILILINQFFSNTP